MYKYYVSINIFLKAHLLKLITGPMFSSLLSRTPRVLSPPPLLQLALISILEPTVLALRIFSSWVLCELWSVTWANSLVCASVTTATQEGKSRTGLLRQLWAPTKSCDVSTQHAGQQPCASRHNSSATSFRKSSWIFQALPNLEWALPSLPTPVMASVPLFGTF